MSILDERPNTSGQHEDIAWPDGLDLVWFVMLLWLRSPPAQTRHINSLKPLLTLLNIELHSFSLLQRFVPFTHNRFEVDKQIFTALASNEAVSLRVVEPLHCALFHGTDPFFYTNPQPGGHGTYIEVVCFKQKIAATALSFTIVAISILLRVCTKEL
jgi:hypothetical protein